MAFQEITALLAGWPGFELIDVKREEATGARPTARIVLTLQPITGGAKVCSRCGQRVAAIHDVTSREIRDLPILDAETWLVLQPAARTWCPQAAIVYDLLCCGTGHTSLAPAIGCACASCCAPTARCSSCMC